LVLYRSVSIHAESYRIDGNKLGGNGGAEGMESALLVFRGPPRALFVSLAFGACFEDGRGLKGRFPSFNLVFEMFEILEQLNMRFQWTYLRFERSIT
jgi:hypothetical protein